MRSDSLGGTALRVAPSFFFALATVATPAQAQVEPPPTLSVPYVVDTGWIRNDTPQERVIISFAVHNEHAEWLRLYFDDVDLGGDVLNGTGAILRITSYEDADVQEMNASHVHQWEQTTAYFNGHTVQVEVIAPPGIGARLKTRALDAGLAHPDDPTICGADNRVFSADPRVARLLPVGCTGWMIDDCDHCMLTAGHCSGSLDVAQFNVPRSRPSGALKHPSAIHQYPIADPSLQTNGGQGVGNDWAHFGTYANSNTGLRPYAAQGDAFVLTTPPGSTAGQQIRITGHGTDNGNQNQAQQTNVGPLVTTSGTSVGYVTDTTGGNSGSPVIWENTGQAIGIHTHGGCSGSSGNNWGTGYDLAALQNAVNNPIGVCQCGGPSGPTVLFSDGFESGDFAAGGWNTVLSPRVKNGAALSGLKGARVRKSTSIERAINTSGFTNIELFYSRRSKNYDAGEFLTVEWFNGATWTTLETVNTTAWSDRSFALPAAAANNPGFRIRFSSNANEGKERGDVDDVLVIGT